MTLRQDIHAGLNELSQADASTSLVLDDERRCIIPVPIPPTVMALQDNQLVIEVVLSKTERFFSLLTPLAVIDGHLSQVCLESLFYRQFYADQVTASSFALAVANDDDILAGVYHWMLDTITPAQFRQLFQKFILAIFDLIGEVHDLAQQEPNLHPVHQRE